MAITNNDHRLISNAFMHLVFSTPDRYLEAGGAKFNDISYQLANQFCIPMEGVHLTDQSGMFHLGTAERGSVIVTSLNSRKTPNLDVFIEVFKDLSHLEIVPLVYHTVSDIHTNEVSMVTTERYWTKFRLCVRNGTVLELVMPSED